MPPNRIEPTQGPDDMAVSSPAPSLAATPALKPWLPFLVTVIVMPVLAYYMTINVLLPRLRQDLGISPAAAEAAPPKAADVKKDSVPMNKLLVNVNGTMGSRYLLVSLTIAGSDPDFRARIQDAEPKLRDMAGTALATKTLADLEKPGARNLIRSELISGFNNILGGKIVEEIYLTEFAIQ